MNISDIVESIGKTGILKPHQYAVTISNGNVGTQQTENLAPRVERITLPPIALSTMEYPSIAKESFPIVKSRSQNEALSLNIISSEDARERKFFEDWIRAIHGNDSFVVTYYDDYTENSFVKISIISKNGEKLVTYQFSEVYPTEVGDIEFSYGDTDTYATFSVTFNWNTVDRVNEL